jgi:hypothetical protein
VDVVGGRGESGEVGRDRERQTEVKDECNEEEEGGGKGKAE